MILYAFIYYLAWLICVQQAAHGHGFIGPIVILAVIISQLLFGNSSLKKICFILTLGVLGTLIDTLLLNIGVIRYAAPYEHMPWLAPLWISSLWALFASLFDKTFGWLDGKWALASLFGAVGGPASYLFAVKMGAGEFLLPTPVAIAILATIWAVVFPTCFWIKKAAIF